MDIKLDGTAFSVMYWKDFGEKEFVAENMKTGVYSSYTDKDRRAMLKDVHKKIVDAADSTLFKAKYKRL